MGFWGAVGNIAGTVAKSLVEEYNDLNEDFKHEQHRLSGASDEELKKKRDRVHLQLKNWRLKNYYRIEV